MLAAVAGVTQQALTLGNTRMRLVHRLAHCVARTADRRLGFGQQRELLFLVENVACQTPVFHYRWVRHRRNPIYDVLMARPTTVQHNLVLEFAGVRFMTQCALPRLLSMGLEGRTFADMITVASSAQSPRGLSQDGALLTGMARVTQQAFLRSDGRMGLFHRLLMALTAHLPLRCF